MKSLRKWAALALCGAMLLAGCGGDTTWAYEQGGEKMPVGVYIMGMVEDYGKVWTDIRNEGNIETIKSKDVMDYQVDGQAGSAWISAHAQQRVLEYYGAAKKAGEIGLELTEEELGNVKSSAASIWNGGMRDYIQQYDAYGMPASAEQFLMRMNQEQLEASGVALASLEQYIAGQMLKSALFNKLYGSGGEREVTQEQLLESYSTQYAKANTLTVYKKFAYEGEEPSEESVQANAASKSLTESYLERVKNGETIEDLQYEYDLMRAQESEEGEAATAEVTEYEPGALEFLFPLTGTMGAADEAVAAATYGEPVMAEDEYAFYVFSRVDISQDVEGMEQYKSSLLWKMKQEEFEADLATWGAEAGFTVNQSAIDKYTPNQLKLTV